MSALFHLFAPYFEYSRDLTAEVISFAATYTVVTRRDDWIYANAPALVS
jgi:hypothetical protein